MNNGDKKEWIERLYNKGMFPFTYKNIADKNPNLGYNIKQSQPKRNIVAKFSTQITNFRSIAKLDGTFNYNFCF